MKKEEVAPLKQLILTVEQQLSALEQAHAKQDLETFNSLKDKIKQLNSQIGGMING